MKRSESKDREQRPEPDLCPLPTYPCACKGNYCRLLGRNVRQTSRRKFNEANGIKEGNDA